MFGVPFVQREIDARQYTLLDDRRKIERHFSPFRTISQVGLLPGVGRPTYRFAGGFGTVNVTSFLAQRSITAEGKVVPNSEASTIRDLATNDA